MAITLKAARVNAGLTQADVAKELKISKTTVHGYESYKISPGVVRAKELAKLFGMGIDEILWGDE